MDNRVFCRNQIEAIFSKVKGKTLFEVDSKRLLQHAVDILPNKVVKGIAGDVIEQSVLGCDKDNKQEPDIIVDGIKTELKTTGVRSPKKDVSRKYEAKEPLTITGVSPNDILKESFYTSHFFKKIEHILFVFYHYLVINPHFDDSGKEIKTSFDYFDMQILGHLFWELPTDTISQLKNDWERVQSFYNTEDKIVDEQSFSNLQKELLLIDTSSPQRPRFRFKRAFVTTIVDTFFNQSDYQSLPEHFERFSDIDKKCHAFTEQYKGKTIDELAGILDINFSNKDGKYNKDTCQQIVLRMFGSKAYAINSIRDFSEIGLIAKTIILTSNGKRTEDMKLCQIDFDEWCNQNIIFADPRDSSEQEYSNIYSYFAEHTFLFIVFEEPSVPEPGQLIPLGKCKFVGFKRYSFDSKFINTDVRKTWEDVRFLVLSRTLKEVGSKNRFAPNFPKSKDNIVFLRGSGSTIADKKPRLIKWGINIKMYIQFVWIKGSYIVSELAKQEYL